MGDWTGSYIAYKTANEFPAAKFFLQIKGIV